MSGAIVLAGVLIVTAASVAGWLRLSRRAARPPATWRLAAILSALAVVTVALASPLDRLAHERFTAHMVQHLLLITVAVPVALLADPFPVLLWALPAQVRLGLRPLLARGGPLRGLLGTLTGMPLAWLLFAVTLWLWHLPVLYERAQDDAWVHALEHASFAAVALVFWWPVLAPAPRVRGPAHPIAAVAYVVLAGFQSAALGLALMLWPTVLYPSHAAPGVNALADQAWGGIVMWSVSGVVDMAVAMALVWRVLAAPERARPGRFLDPHRPVRENRPVHP